MRTILRSSALVALLSIVAPIAVVSAPRAAYAQADKVTELARSKFIEGITAFDARRYAEARELFLQAYAIKRHPAVLLNLGLSEVRSGEAADGGNHLQQFLREFEQANPQQKDSAREGIAEAKRRAAYVYLISDTDGAYIIIDGQVVGKSPMADPVFVAPGEHQVEARYNGRGTKVKIQARLGALASAQLNLRNGLTEEVAMPDEEEPEVAPKPKVRPKPTPVPVEPEPEPNMNELPPAESGPYLSGGIEPFPASSDASTGPKRPGFITWLKSKPAAMITLGVGGGLGLIGTIGFGAAAGSASSSATDVSNAILAEVRNPSDPSGQLPASYYDASGNPIPCGSLDNPASSHPYYRGACDQLRDNLDSYDTDIALMATSLAIMGASVVGTTVWYFVDTSKGSTAPATATAPSGTFAIAPMLSPQHQGLGIVGTF